MGRNDGAHGDSRKKNRRSYSLRAQMFALMALLVVLQMGMLLFSLSVSNVFVMVDGEAYRVFSSAAQNRAKTFNRQMVELQEKLAAEASQLSVDVSSLASENETYARLLYKDNALFAQESQLCAVSLLRVLRSSDVSGAFVIFTGSNANQRVDGVHSAVYIRTTDPGSDEEKKTEYMLEMGVSAIALDNHLLRSPTHHYDLIFGADNQEEKQSYRLPFEASLAFPGSSMDRYGYWSQPVDLLGTGQEGLFYTLPLLDWNRQPFAVLGVEISMPLLAGTYLPEGDFAYPDSFYAMVTQTDGGVQPEWLVPGGAYQKPVFPEGAVLPLQPAGYDGVWQAEVEGIGTAGCVLNPLDLYRLDSPFQKREWSLAAFTSKEALQAGSGHVRRNLYISMGVTTLVSFAALLLFSLLATRGLKGLLRYVKALRPEDDLEFRATGILEMDELTREVEKLNRNVRDSAQRISTIMEMTDMPVGCFEVDREAGYVMLTEYIYELLGRQRGQGVAPGEWERLLSLLTARPEKEYENVYRYRDPQTGHRQWLRIQQAETQNGCVGTILDVSEDIQRSRRLAYELDHDALTHLYNRTAFKREVHRVIGENPGERGAMLFVDLDNLKYTNDTYGHEMGDKLLVKAGEAFCRFERMGGIIARISGDEFAIYLHGLGEKPEAFARIQEVYRACSRETLVTSGGQRQRVRFSAGLAWYPDDSDTVTDLLKLSDYAMYEAKHSSKGSLRQFDQGSYQENAYLLKNREAINRLVDERLIRFAFQPIVDLCTGEIYGYEALMRPLLEDFGSPLEILAVAAAQSKMNQLERMVVLTAFEFLHRHQEQFGPRRLFINSVPSQRMPEEDRRRMLERYGPLMSRVVVEITEDKNSSKRQLDDKVASIREMGLQLAIDDFGAGYSNEVRMLSLNPDIVKIDRDIIWGIHKDPDKQKLVSNIVSFCKPKGIRLIAEGVEDREDLLEVVRQGIDYVQGYYTGRPDFALQEIDPEVVAFIRSLH